MEGSEFGVCLDTEVLCGICVLLLVSVIVIVIVIVIVLIFVFEGTTCMQRLRYFFSGETLRVSRW